MEKQKLANNSSNFLFRVIDGGIRVDSWLALQLEDYSRTYIRKLIDSKNIKVNARSVKANYKVKSNDIIEIVFPEPKQLSIEPENIPLDIVYEDKYIVVVNKPKGMVVHPAPGHYSGTLVNALLYYCGSSLSDMNGVIRPGIVHRIDKDTTGLLVVAKDNKAHEILVDMLKKHEIKRIYEAVVEGVITEESGTIDAPIGRHPLDRKKMAVNTKNGRHAVTHFTVIKRYSSYTYIRCHLETGRTHQIRVHMAYIKHPILKDEVYGCKNNLFISQGQVLHARFLMFKHPITGKQMNLEAPLPQYFVEILKKLETL